jgi:hypothetical protein
MYAPMITVQNLVGRLVEARFASPLTDDELAHFADQRGRAVQQVNHDRIVCVDATQMSVLPPEQSERLWSAMRRPSTGLLRSAFLLPSRAIVALQFERVVKEAQGEARAFKERHALEQWLGALLTAPELARLRLFLDGK